MNHHHPSSRRSFLRNTAGASLSLALGNQGLASAGLFATSLAAMGSAAAQTVTSSSPYKALVCLFMYGGNDSHNWVYPFDATRHRLYADARGGEYSSSNPGGLALPVSVGATAMAASNRLYDRQFTMAPLLQPLRELYDSSQLAVLANVGPMMEPTTRAEYDSGLRRDRTSGLMVEHRKPPKLFSHNDQQSIWQASAPEGARDGWAGRMGDLLRQSNTHQVFTSISVTGNTVLLAGRDVVQYQVGVDGSISLQGVNGTSSPFPNTLPPIGSTTAGAKALEAMQLQNLQHPMQAEYVRLLKQSINTDSLFKRTVFSGAFNGNLEIPNHSYTDVPNGHPASLQQDSLAKQLRMVAQIISRHNESGARRQVFMVSIGGFDTHNHHHRDQAILMQRVAHSVKYFTNAMTRLGMADNVTLFTASDFGRTLTSNGKGSDHGWGSTHFIAGGAGGSGITRAVKGQNIYGQMAPAGLKHEWDLGSGRLLPTTSVDQYAATLGKWFGLSTSDLNLVLPNLEKFDTKDLGFMGPSTRT